MDGNFQLNAMWIIENEGSYEMKKKVWKEGILVWARLTVGTFLLFASFLIMSDLGEETAFAQWGPQWGTGSGGYGGSGGGYAQEGGYGAGPNYGAGSGQWAGPPPAQYTPPGSPIIYPNRGQSPQQEETDKMQCYSWAKQTSGFDPMAPIQPTAPPPGPEVAQGGLLRGGAGGAAAGLAAGSLFGQAGKGAAVGAMTGGLVGGMRRREQVQRMDFEQQQYLQQQGTILQQKRGGYNRAFGACMSGRGYTVN